MPKTYNELYITMRTALRAAGVEASALEARLLLAHAADKPVEKLLQDLQLYTSDEIEARAQQLLTRRLAGEPAAYLTGQWSFYGLELKIPPEVLIPRSDTETLVAQALALAGERTAPLRILDLCTGSGCIGCALAAQLPNSRAVMIDKSEKALIAARENVRRCGLSARCVCMEADACAPPQGMLGSFDMIVSNPPYIPTAELETLDVSVRAYEPRMALDGGADGLDFYRAILRHWTPLLRRSGHLLFEVGETQAEEVGMLMRRANLRGIGTAQDTAGIARVVYGRL